MNEFRKNFGRIRKILEIPNLIDIQKKSYEKFLQKEVAPLDRGALDFRVHSRASSQFPTLAGSARWNL